MNLIIVIKKNKFFSNINNCLKIKKNEIQDLSKIMDERKEKNGKFKIDGKKRKDICYKCNNILPSIPSSL